MESIVFTPAGLIEILCQIDELKDLDIGVTETLDGNIQLQVGDSTYEISNDEGTIPVEQDVVDEIEDINLEAYENLEDNGMLDTYEESIESGIIKEIAKTLLVGGMARLTAKVLKG